MESTSVAAEASMAEVEEESPATKSMENDEKENCNRICDGETGDVLGNYLLKSES